ncbi:MAG TPA: protein TolR [Steroidobacteraceae bacterium]|nr:protein TolR [Steroidobacteraceae bacterium]
MGGTGTDAAPRKRRLIGEINVVPLIDVMLVLLVIFMATAPLLTQGVKVELPQASSQPLPQSQTPEPPVVLTIDRDGRRFLNIGATGQPLADDELREAVRAALAADPRRDVLIRADTHVAYGGVIGAMVLLQAAGAAHLGFVTEPPPPPPPRGQP